MMWARDEIGAALGRTGIHAVELQTQAAEAAMVRLERAFARPGGRALWERLVDGEGVQDPNAWRLVSLLVAGPLVLLVHDGHKSCGYRFESSAELVQVLSECPGFMFFVTDDHERYLLVFTDHDVLIGAGEAAAWIRRLGQQDA